jgi:hypothetical protein
MQLNFGYSMMGYLMGQAWPPGPAFIDPGDLVAIIVIPSFCLMIGWLVWLLTRTNHLKTKARIELHQRLLERMNSVQEIVQLMQTDEGRRFLEALSVDRTTQLEQIRATVQKGVILTTVGLGALSIRLFFQSGFGVFIVMGILVCAGGLGLLISAGVAYRLSRTWDLLEKRAGQSDVREASLFR